MSWKPALPSAERGAARAPPGAPTWDPSRSPMIFRGKPKLWLDGL